MSKSSTSTLYRMLQELANYKHDKKYLENYYVRKRLSQASKAFYKEKTDNYKYIAYRLTDKMGNEIMNSINHEDNK